MTEIPRPDHSKRQLTMTCERVINASASGVFAAWTHDFDLWFAQPGTLVLRAHPGEPYFFYNRNEWGRHPHYGRMLDIRENELIEMTWMTGDGSNVGTAGAETVLRIELLAQEAGTLVRLTHSGFVSESSRDGHAENWPLALDALADALAGQRRS